MKNHFKTAILLIVAGAIMTACDDWNNVKSKLEPESFPVGYGRDEAYYENLRAFKSTMFDRRLSWCWYGGWTGEGAFLKNCLSGLPDSMDIISIWGSNWTNLTDVMKEDLAATRKKGTKVIVTQLAGNLGAYIKGPEQEGYMEYWGWEEEPSGTNSTPSQKQQAAIRKYAQELSRKILDSGFDGYDLDWEGRDTPGSIASYPNRLLIFIDEMSKHIGRKVGNGTILVMDGLVNGINYNVAPYFDLYVLQYYFNTGGYGTSTSALNSKITSALNNLTKHPDVTADDLVYKVIATETYESSQHLYGGAVATMPDGSKSTTMQLMSVWTPTYNGKTYPRNAGMGIFHIDYGYDSPGNYPGFYSWMREAIQTMNTAGVVE